MSDILRVALIGNPNCGKTTLFNLLTGSRHYVGNRPGVTVCADEGTVIGAKFGCPDFDFILVDLPGTYSLSPASDDEKITADYLKSSPPDLILNIADLTNINRNMFLTTELAELGIPMIIALNMCDEAEKKGIFFDTDIFLRETGIPSVKISAAEKIGIRELIAALYFLSQNKKSVPRIVFPKNPEKRYSKINALLSSCLKSGNVGVSTSDKIDRILLNKFLAVPIFLAVMLAVFYITFGPVGNAAKAFFEHCLDFFIKTPTAFLLERSGAGKVISSLVLDGIIGGVGSVLSFLPQIMLFFLFLSLLEDCGYMARAAFIADSFFRKFGLNGKFFIPIMIGFGCSVPAVMSLRALPDKKERALALFILPFISCSARTPVYALFAASFFGKFGGLVVFLIYLLGILLVLLFALLYKKVFKRGAASPFIMEMPPYRSPKLSSVLQIAFDRGKEFLVRAGKIIFVASVVIWLLYNFQPNFAPANAPSESILAQIGKIIAPIFLPLGFGNYRAVSALASGVLAKEAIISSLEIMYAKSGGLSSVLLSGEAFSAASAISYIVFVSLYVPCVSTIAVIKSESAKTSIKGKNAVPRILLFCFAVAYAVSFIAYRIMLLFF